jgi:hypothetical protein
MQTFQNLIIQTKTFTPDLPSFIERYFGEYFLGEKGISVPSTIKVANLYKK